MWHIFWGGKRKKPCNDYEVISTFHWICMIIWLRKFLMYTAGCQHTQYWSPSRSLPAISSVTERGPWVENTIPCVPLPTTASIALFHTASKIWMSPGWRPGGLYTNTFDLQIAPSSLPANTKLLGSFWNKIRAILHWRSRAHDLQNLSLVENAKTVHFTSHWRLRA